MNRNVMHRIPRMRAILFSHYWYYYYYYYKSEAHYKVLTILPFSRMQSPTKDFCT